MGRSSFPDTPLIAVTFVRVVDGDTIIVRFSNGTEERVRLLGIDTPESVAHDGRDCKEGVVASHYLKKHLKPGCTLWLQRDVSDRDKFSRLLRCVWLQQPDDPGLVSHIRQYMLNAILIAEGLARPVCFEPDDTLYELFSSLAIQAAKEHRGVSSLWAADLFDR